MSLRVTVQMLQVVTKSGKCARNKMKRDSYRFGADWISSFGLEHSVSTVLQERLLMALLLSQLQHCCGSMKGHFY